MEVTKKQAETLSKIGVKCFLVTTGKIDYAENPVLSEKYECILSDYDLPKTGKDLLAELFEKNSSNGLLAVNSFLESYTGEYVYMSLEELVNFEVGKTTGRNRLFSQLEKEKAATEKIIERNVKHPRKMKKELAENAKKIGIIETYISRYNG